MKIKRIKAKLKSKDKYDEEPVPAEDLLSFGSALANLASTGRVRGGIAKEDYALFVGDSQAGKTWLALTTLAEAANNKHFEDYSLYYDNVENGAKMDFRKFWGNRMAGRVKPPRGSRLNPEYSSTLQEFYFNLDDALDKGPCIYVLDSMDGLDAEEDIEQFEKEKNAYRKGKEVSGSYGTAKAKRNSQNIRNIIRKLRKTKSILIIIAQSRDKIGGMIPGQKTRGGGRSLKFYAHIEIWLSKKKDIDKEIGIGGKKTREPQAIIAKLKVEKSRHTGREKAVELPIYWSVGIDDLGSCIDYLVEKGHWKKKKGGIIIAKEFKMSGKKEQIVHYVEDNDREKELYGVVSRIWRELDKQLEIRRKSRYV
jgi:hypothetical protein